LLVKVFVEVKRSKLKATRRFYIYPPASSSPSHNLADSVFWVRM
jgi:hypothetical protein